MLHLAPRAAVYSTASVRVATLESNPDSSARWIASIFCGASFSSSWLSGSVMSNPGLRCAQTPA
jgi:hypothetical protein